MLRLALALCLPMSYANLNFYSFEDITKAPGTLSSLKNLGLTGKHDPSKPQGVHFNFQQRQTRSNKVNNLVPLQTFFTEAILNPTGRLFMPVFMLTLMYKIVIARGAWGKVGESV